MEKDKRKISFKNVITIVAVAVLLIVACVYYFYNRTTDENYSGDNSDKFIFGVDESIAERDDLIIHFIDVGQGDCIFIQFPDGKNMLIDGGLAKTSDSVITYLNNLGVEKIDLVLATHSDADHIGGLPAIFEAYEVSYCLRPMVYYGGAKKLFFSGSFNISPSDDSAFYCQTDSYFAFLNAVKAEGCGWSFFNKDSDFTQVFNCNGIKNSYTFDFFTPVADVKNISYQESNNYSPICMLSYSKCNVMFVGDAEEYTEKEFLNFYKNNPYPDVDVLKVGHHGSSDASSANFIAAIEPEYAVISCGAENEYGHPSSQTLNRLSSCWIYRTDVHGDVVLTISDGTPSFTPTIEELAGML